MSDQTISIIFFVLIIALTIGITVWALRQNKSTSDHYVAGGSIKGWQNGLAISGDYLSVASFLGIAGAISLTGFSGFYLSIGFLIAYLVVLLLVAEPLRNLGKYTFADMLASRFNKSSVRSAAALSTIAISMFYMIAQLNGAGALIELLLGINYTLSVIVIGILMTICIVAGGMSENGLLADFSDLTREEIRACLAFAAEREHNPITGIAASSYPARTWLW